MSKLTSYEGNSTWNAKEGVGSTGPFCTFGLATDDGQYGRKFEVIAFGAAASAAAKVRKGDRVRVHSHREPRDRCWTTADGSEHHGFELVATSVEVLAAPAVPVEVARERIVSRILACSPDDVLSI